MRTIFVIAAAANVLSVLALLIVARKWSCYLYDEGHRDGNFKGYRAGFDAGRKSADGWWLEIEQQVGIEREKIWREEA
jgi:hypothetical protein